MVLLNSIIFYFFIHLNISSPFYTGKVTIEKIRERSQDPNGNIFLFVTTSVMLLGLNIKDIHIVILFSPFGSLNSLLQAGGRSGRRCENGTRNKSVVYTLFNNSEIRANHPNQDKNVREYYTTQKCLKNYMHSFFSLVNIPSQPLDWCCSNCS